MGGEDSSSRFSAEDANKAVKELTETLAGLKGKGTVDPGGRSWFFPDGIDLIDVTISFGVAGLATLEVKVAGPKSSQIATPIPRGPNGIVQAPPIDVDDTGDHTFHDGESITWVNRHKHPVVVLFDTVYGCPLASGCFCFTVPKNDGTKDGTYTGTVRDDACGPYPYHVESPPCPKTLALAEKAARQSVLGMPRIIIQ